MTVWYNRISVIVLVEDVALIFVAAPIVILDPVAGEKVAFEEATWV